MLNLGEYEAPLSDLGVAALNYALEQGANYVSKLLKGVELTEEEKDEFYAVIETAFRKQREGSL